MSDQPPAELDQRLIAGLIDRALGWGLIGLAAFAAARVFWGAGDVWPGIALVLGVALLAWVVFAVLEATSGRTPGKAVAGVRLVGESGPLRPGPAVLRALVKGLAGIPTAGIGLASLAWTVAADPSHHRRGWHDRLGHARVVDVRPAPVVAEAEPERPKHVVNLTAMRLAPRPAAAEAVIERPARAVERTPRPAPAPAPPEELPTWTLTFDSGQEIVLTGVALLGRSPQPRPGETVAHLVPLPSADMSVSKTHAQVHIAADGALVVIDRGSTNGSLLLRKGVGRELSAGRATTMLDGDKLRLGDQTVTVSRG